MSLQTTSTNSSSSYNNTSTSTLDTTSEWNPSADIYSTVETIENLKNRYIDESEDTLSLGIFGFISDLEAKKIQSAIVRTGELGNEMFPARAKLDKNIITHAVYQNVNGLNATPAACTMLIGIKVSDFDQYKSDNIFVFEKTQGIFLGDNDEYEFHFIYDLILEQVQTSNTKQATYSIRYDMTSVNPVVDSEGTDISPYLDVQPQVMSLLNDQYIIFYAELRQVTYETTTDKITKDSAIANKTFIFEFSNQMANFVVYAEEEDNTTYTITPLIYGSPIDSDAEYYCWYLYVNDHTIRITFDSNSYIPSINTTITVEAQVTLGEEGNFSYKIGDESGTKEVSFESTTYGYSEVKCYVVPTSASTGGVNKKDIDELQEIVHKYALSRGYLTTETDLNNHFNLIDTDNSRLLLQKKVDNQLDRIWYSYTLLKDEYGNIIPTNTITVQADINDDYCILSDDGRYVIPSGTYFEYDSTTQLAVPIDETDIPELYSDDYFNGTTFYYISPFNIAICLDPLYTSFYMTNVSNRSYFIFKWLNENCELQFVATSNTIERKLLTDKNIYTFTFSISQSILADYEMYYTTTTSVDSEDEDEDDTDTSTDEDTTTDEESDSDTDTDGDTDSDTDSDTSTDSDTDTDSDSDTDDEDSDDDEDDDTTLEEVVVNNMKCILVLFKDGVAYRWIEAELTEFDDEYWKSTWEINFTTDNALDIYNNIKLTDLGEAGYSSTNYGFFPNNTEAYLYILAYFDEEYGRYDLDDIVPGLDGYSVTNVYEVYNGLSLFRNYTSMINTKVTALDGDDEGKFNITSIPMLGAHYAVSEEYISYFMDALETKRIYVEDCLEVVENSMNIDLKFYNTYGPSYTYTIADEDLTLLDEVDISLKFRIQLVSESDIYTTDTMVTYIKEFIENINDIGDLHFTNLITAMEQEFASSVVYVEFMSFNDNRLGLNHLEVLDVDDPHTVPEFLNVRNYYDADTDSLIPCIEIECVS